jgi:hypothetical protein
VDDACLRSDHHAQSPVPAQADAAHLRCDTNVMDSQGTAIGRTAEQELRSDADGAVERAAARAWLAAHQR